MENEQEFTDRYFGSGEPEPVEEYDDTENDPGDIAAFTEQLSTLNQNLAQQNDQQVASDFLNTEDEQGWTNAEKQELWQDQVDRRFQELTDPHEQGQRAIQSWEQDYEARLQAQQEQQEQQEALQAQEQFVEHMAEAAVAAGVPNADLGALQDHYVDTFLQAEQDGDIEAARAQGYSDEEIAQAIGQVSAESYRAASITNRILSGPKWGGK
jgi:signal transduction histidine kinase